MMTMMMMWAYGRFIESVSQPVGYNNDTSMYILNLRSWTSRHLPEVICSFNNDKTVLFK